MLCSDDRRGFCRRQRASSTSAGLTIPPALLTRANEVIELRVATLISGRPRENRRHQLRRTLINFCCLAAELTVNCGRKQNVGDDEGSRSGCVGGELLLQDAIELAHATPFLGLR